MTDYSGLILDVTVTDAAQDKEFLERLGHPVLVCHGPDWGRACPIIRGQCPMVESAHGVIFQLDLDRPQHRVILKRYQESLDVDATPKCCEMSKCGPKLQPSPNWMVSPLWSNRLTNCATPAEDVRATGSESYFGLTRFAACLARSPSRAEGRERAAARRGSIRFRLETRQRSNGHRLPSVRCLHEASRPCRRSLTTSQQGDQHRTGPLPHWPAGSTRSCP